MKINSNTPQAAKRPYNLSLNERTVVKARQYTDNLSATVDSLLAEFIAGKIREAEELQRERDKICDVWNRYREAHESFADEHNRL